MRSPDDFFADTQGGGLSAGLSSLAVKKGIVRPGQALQTPSAPRAGQAGHQGHRQLPGRAHAEELQAERRLAPPVRRRHRVAGPADRVRRVAEADVPGGRQERAARGEVALAQPPEPAERLHVAGPVALRDLRRQRLAVGGAGACRHRALRVARAPLPAVALGRWIGDSRPPRPRPRYRWGPRASYA